MRLSGYYLTSLVIVSCYLNGSSTILPIASSLPKVSKSYDSILLKTWQGIKTRNIDPYSLSLVHRPKSEYPGDAVSEGVGYGMLLAIYCNDQKYFNKLWFTAEKNMWQGSFYDWWLGADGKKGGMGFTGAATDAEEDIAVALIFADQLVKKGIWSSSGADCDGVSYNARAKVILESIKTNMLEGSYVRPGAGWGGAGFVNPGYFAPAWYRVFAEFDSTGKSIWNSVIDQCYTTIFANPGFESGLIPDWMQPNGKYNETALGYNPTGDGKWMYKDGIRVLWRLATDYLWYDEPRAKTFLQKSMKFIGEPSKANFYQMDGSEATGTWKLGNGVERPRSEHSPLTIGMWACASMCLGVEEAEKYSDELLKYYDEGADYWGRAKDLDGIDSVHSEDTLHNEMYFDQFLAWFGASLISGVWTNIWEDMKDPDPTTPLEWLIYPKINMVDINADKTPLTISAEMSKSARWTITLTSRETPGSEVVFSGSGKVIDLNWYGLSLTGEPMPQGYYDVTVKAKGMDTSAKLSVWLGKSLSLMDGSRLIIDDFRDGDIRPFFGSTWTSYLDSYEGKAGKSSVKKLAVEENGSSSELHWQYLLDAGNLGFDPYAAVEWNNVADGKMIDLTGIDTVIITARAKSDVGISFQFATTDITDYSYYDDSLYLTTSNKEYKVPVNELKQRFGGSAKLDLTKVSGIRLQVQQKTGTENELIISKIVFAGNVSKLYTAPPAYKQISVIYPYRSAAGKKIISSVNVTSQNLTVKLNKSLVNGKVMLVNAAGKTISQIVNVRSNIISMNSGMSGHGIVSGLYFISIRDNNNFIATVPVHIMK